MVRVIDSADNVKGCQEAVGDVAVRRGGGHADSAVNDPAGR
jgi:hypothetical protein